MQRRILSACVLLWLSFAAALGAQSLSLVPFHTSGIYSIGEPAGWTVTARPGDSPTHKYVYTLKRNGAAVIKSGEVDLTSGAFRIEASLDRPGTLYLEIAGGEKPMVAGACISPTQLQPSTPRPSDFDEFWAAKLKLLNGIPADPVLTPEDSGTPGVEYATIRLNNIGGAHVYGQIAKPARPGKFPAMLILQWASPPYPLQKQWVTDRAAEGWLALNVEPHDVPCHMPAEFYASLPELIKNYASIYNDDRDRNYFLGMYLGDYRAMDYLAGRPDWDGKILLVTGTNMGGQQSFAVAGLCPKVTHMIVHVPAGADSNAALNGRAEGYPNWDRSNPKVMQAALYFDTVNFASRIHATCLVSMGFVDTACPAVGVWTAFNQIAGRKEAVPMVNSPHNHLATAEQQRPYTELSAAWLARLVHDQEPEVRAP